MLKESDLKSGSSVNPVRAPGRLAMRIAGVGFIAFASVACSPTYRLPELPLHGIDSSLGGSSGNILTSLRGSPDLMIARDVDLVRLRGTLASAYEVASVIERATKLYGPEMMINELTINSALPQSEWLGGVLDTAASMVSVEKFDLRAIDGELRLSGSVVSAETAAAIAKTAEGSVASGLTVVNDLRYPGIAADQALADNAPLIQAPLIESPIGGLLSQDELLPTEVPASLNIPVSSLMSAAPAIELVERPVSNNSGESDTDGDRIPKKYDQCLETEPGFPVDQVGCRQYLNGYLKNVRFYGSTHQLTRRAMLSLDNLASVMREYPATQLAVMSFSNNSGTPWELKQKSSDRAKSVVTYLVRQGGVELDRLTAYSMGHINNSGDQIMIKELDQKAKSRVEQ